MQKKHAGFTLIELLVVIAIIAVLAGLLLPTLSSVQDRALRAKVKTTVNQLSQAVKAYETDNGHYPLMKNNGGADQGGTYKYRNDVLIPNLDGDTTTGNNTPTIQYFEFTQQDCQGNVYLDHFGEPFWYFNYHAVKPVLTGKTVSTSDPLHPWHNVIHFRGIQIYTQANFPEDPYGGKPKKEDNFQWITNYTK